MKTMKRIAALVLSIALVCSFAMPAFAEDTATTPKPLIGSSGSISGQSPTLQADIAFAKFVSGKDGNPPEDAELIASAVLNDRASRDDRKFAIYKKEDLKHTAANFDKNKVAEQFTISDPSVLGIEVTNIPNRVPPVTEGNVILVTPKKSGKATITHKATGCTLEVTVNMPEDGFYDLSGNRIVRTTLADLTTEQSFSLKDADGNVIDKLQKSEFAYHDSYIDLKVNDAKDGITVKRLRYDTDMKTVVFTRGALNLKLEISLPPIASGGLTIELVKGKETDAGGATLSGTTETLEQNTESPNKINFPVCFQIFNADGTPHPINSTSRVNLDNAKVSYTFNETQDPSISGKFFELEQMSNGEWFLTCWRKEVGTFTISFDVTFEGKTCTTRPFTVKVEPKKAANVITVEPGYSINKAIQDLKRDHDIDWLVANPTKILLKAGEYNHPDDDVILLDIPVLIEGNGRNAGDDTKSTFVISELRYDLPNNTEGEIANLVLVGNGKDKGETGVRAEATNAGDMSGQITIIDFAIGIDAIEDQHTMVGASIENCGIGKRYSVIHPGDISISRGSLAFENNDVAIYIKPEGSNPTHNAFAFGVMYCNFKGNKINVKNESTTPFNFSFNYFDDVSEDKFVAAGNGVKPRSSPYFKEWVNTQNPPTETFIAVHELDDVQANTNVLTKETTINKSNFTVGTKIDIVQPGETTAKLSGWKFNTITPDTAAPEFHPAIDTKLPEGSQTVVDSKLPVGATYQPVAFSHHGKLPGTAEVTVTRSATTANDNLKLYKIENGNLVLQSDTVTFANGEYKFLRDGASDYIITDADVTVAPPATDGSDSGSSSGSNGSNDYTGSNEINNKLETATSDNVSISVAGKPYVAASSFDLLKKNPEKTLTFKGDGYSWSFKGSDVTGNIAGLMYLNTEISSKSPNAEEIKKATGDAEIINVYFGYHGKLPGKATIEMSVDSKYEGKTLNLYYYNPTTKQLEALATGLVVKNGKVSFDITHCSDYILSPVALKATAATTAPVINNPETGAIDRIPLATAVAVLSCISVSALLYTKKSR